MHVVGCDTLSSHSLQRRIVCQRSVRAFCCCNSTATKSTSSVIVTANIDHVLVCMAAMLTRRYTVQTAAHGAISCQYIVNATGKNAVLNIPSDLPCELLQLVNTHTAAAYSSTIGAVKLASTTSTTAGAMSVLHSSQVRDLTSIAHKRVCIVGCGNSGVDIATEIIRLRQQAAAAQHRTSSYSSSSSSSSGATAAACEPVHMSIRHVPPVIMRQWGCLSLEWISKHCASYMPAAVVDAVLEACAALRWGYSWKQRVFPSELLKSSTGSSSAWGAMSSGRIPLIDKGTGSFVDSVMVSGHADTHTFKSAYLCGHVRSETSNRAGALLCCIVMPVCNTRHN
jgi:Flavin-binding monooxygenase-like